MDKAEWIDRCAKRYVEVAALPYEQGCECAEAIYEDREEDETPEDAADEDLSCWTDDGE